MGESEKEMKRSEGGREEREETKKRGKVKPNTLH